MGFIYEVNAAPTELVGLPDDGKYNSVALGDVDNNGYLDIVAGAGGYPGGDPGGLYVYLNQDGGSFSDGSSGLPGPGSDYFGSVQVIDIDKDSNLDIIAAYESHWSGGNDKGIGIWFGNGGSGGSMAWSSATSPAISGSFDSAYCADIDGDDVLDMVGGSGNGIFAWRGDHTGKTLSWTETRTGLPTSGEYTGVTLGDVNNDDRLDIVAGSYSGDGISVYLCSSAGTISWGDGHTDTNLHSGGNTFDMCLTDFNGDSNLDLVSSIRGGIKCYLGNGNSGSKDTWWEEVSSGLPTSGDYYQLTVEDINNDGKIDIGSQFRVWSNSGSMADGGSFSWEERDLGISEPSEIGLAIGDLDNDGNPDIAGCGWGSGVNAYTLEVSSPVDYYFIRGTVTDAETGSPLSGVTVITDAGGYVDTTDTAGKYELNVSSGSYQLTATLTGYDDASKIVDASKADAIIDFQLHTTSNDPEEFILSGTITDSDSSDPLAGVTVTLTPGGYSTTTTELGQYSFNVPNGSYILTAMIGSAPAETTNVEINGNDVSRNLQLTQPQLPPDDDDDGDSLSSILLAVMIIVVTILVLLGFIIKFRKRK